MILLVDICLRVAEPSFLGMTSENDAYTYDVAEVPKPKRKKRKVTSTPAQGLLGPGWERWDATGLVEHYTHQSQVPTHLRKCVYHHRSLHQSIPADDPRYANQLDFFQRERYFSLYNEGCLLDEEGWYSVTPERVANQIAERCRCGTILDAFCGVGGNAIAFAQTCERGESGCGTIASDTASLPSFWINFWPS